MLQWYNSWHFLFWFMDLEEKKNLFLAHNGELLRKITSQFLVSPQCCLKLSLNNFPTITKHYLSYVHVLTKKSERTTYLPELFIWLDYCSNGQLAIPQYIYPHNSLTRQGWHPQIFMAGTALPTVPQETSDSRVTSAGACWHEGLEDEEGMKEEMKEGDVDSLQHKPEAILIGLGNNLDSSQLWHRQCWDAQSSSLPHLLGAGVPAVLNHSTRSQAFFFFPLAFKAETSHWNKSNKSYPRSVTDMHSKIIF